MVSAIFEELGNIASSFIDFLKSVFGSIGGLFYTPGTGSESGSLTLLGTLMLIGLATGLVMWAFYFIRSLIRVRRG